MYAGATAKVIHADVAEHAGRRERDGHHQYRDADPDQVRRDDEDGQDELNAYPSAALAFRDPPSSQEP